jgi:DNA-binding NarL/FixJ family response regulator
LTAGEIHRRARRRAKAREAFASAVRDFESLGAGLWAAYAHEELQRVGAPREEGASLTPTQAQVAELVTQGLTNRQVGDRLFMSPHTVEAHLTAVYRALGIRSRAELADALRASIDPATPRDPEVTPRDSTPPEAAKP